MKEAQELCEPTYEYAAKPLEDNLFEWHFTFRGPESSEFEGGIYHGRIILPPEYPMKPPSIILLNVSLFFCFTSYSLSLVVLYTKRYLLLLFISDYFCLFMKLYKV